MYLKLYCEFISILLLGERIGPFVTAETIDRLYLSSNQTITKLTANLKKYLDTCPKAPKSLYELFGRIMCESDIHLNKQAKRKDELKVEQFIAIKEKILLLLSDAPWAMYLTTESVCLKSCDLVSRLSTGNRKNRSKRKLL